MNLTEGGSCEARDYAQPLPKFPITAPQKPSMSSKLNKVAELFELDVLNEDEALKACKVIIGQHAKKQGHAADNKDSSIKKIETIETIEAKIAAASLHLERS